MGNVVTTSFFSNSTQKHVNKLNVQSTFTITANSFRCDSLIDALNSELKESFSLIIMTFTCSRLIQSLRRDWRQHNRYKIQSFEASDCITAISSCRICHLVFLNRQGYREALCTFRTIENTDFLRKIQPFSSLNGWVIIQISVVLSGRSLMQFLSQQVWGVGVCVCKQLTDSITFTLSPSLLSFDLIQGHTTAWLQWTLHTLSFWMRTGSWVIATVSCVSSQEL